MRTSLLLLAAPACLVSSAFAEKPADSPPRLRIVPLPDREFSFRLEGEERVRWHAGEKAPRPFFYPFRGPSGATLTRMGHPGAANHDHHRSVWFAHHDVEGHDFWSEQTEARIRQRRWLAIADGNEEALYAAELDWLAPDGSSLLDQELVVALRPAPGGAHDLEVQVTLRPGGARSETTLARTNYGLFAVRVAKSISAHFGGGGLASSEGAEGEGAIFEKRARWMDYSGPVAVTRDGDRGWTTEGITFFDHPDNPRHPAHWHVRDDGWMGPAFCFEEPWTVAADAPLVLRYLLHAHAGALDREEAEARFRAFAERPPFVVKQSSRPHRQFEVRRESATE